MSGLGKKAWHGQQLPHLRLVLEHLVSNEREMARPTGPGRACGAQDSRDRWGFALLRWSGVDGCGGHETALLNSDTTAAEVRSGGGASQLRLLKAIHPPI